MKCRVSKSEGDRIVQAFHRDQHRVKQRIYARQPPSIALIDITQAWRQMAIDYPGTHAVTLAYNNHVGKEIVPVDPNRIHSDLDQLHWRVDLHLYGSHVNRRKAEKRTSFISFLEHTDQNVHVHAAWRVPQDRHHEFSQVVAKEWADVSYKTSEIEEVFSDGWAEYITKDVWQHALNGDARRFFASRCQINLTPP